MYKRQLHLHVVLFRVLLAALILSAVAIKEEWLHSDHLALLAWHQSAAPAFLAHGVGRVLEVASHILLFVLQVAAGLDLSLIHI